MIVTIFINVSTSLVSCAMVVFQCLPMSLIFNPDTDYKPRQPLRCLDAYGLAVAIPAANLGLDIMVALLPVRMILTISLPGKSKVMTLIMLGLGALYVISQSP